MRAVQRDAAGSPRVSPNSLNPPHEWGIKGVEKQSGDNLPGKAGRPISLTFTIERT